MAPAVLEKLIVAEFAKNPMGVMPKGSVIATQTLPDGSSSSVVTPVNGPVFVDQLLAGAIAKSVANAVVAFLQSSAVVNTTGPAAPAGVILSVGKLL